MPSNTVENTFNSTKPAEGMIHPELARMCQKRQYSVFRLTMVLEDLLAEDAELPDEEALDIEDREDAAEMADAVHEALDTQPPLDIREWELMLLDLVRILDRHFPHIGPFICQGSQ